MADWAYESCPFTRLEHRWSRRQVARAMAAYGMATCGKQVRALSPLTPRPPLSPYWQAIPVTFSSPHQASMRSYTLPVAVICAPTLQPFTAALGTPVRKVRQ